MTTDVNNAMNQSELEGNTWNRRQARENACEEVTNGKAKPTRNYFWRNWKSLCCEKLIMHGEGRYLRAVLGLILIIKMFV